MIRAFAPRLVLIVAAVCCSLLVLPSLAHADMTVSSSSSNSGLTQSGCTFTATSANSTVSVGKLDTCLTTATTATTLDNKLSGGGNIIFGTAVAAASCTFSSLTAEDDGGNIELNAPVDLGTGSCEFYADPDSGDISQLTTSSSPLTAYGFYPDIDGSGTLDLESSSNEIEDFGGELGGAATLIDDASLRINTVTGGSDMTLLESYGALTLAGTITGPDFLGLLGESGVSETGTSSTVTAPELAVIYGGAVSLNNANDVSELEVEDEGGAGVAGFTDAASGGLDVTTSSAGADLNIANTGSVSVTGPVGTAAGTVSLTSSTGSISEDGGALQAPALDLSAPDGAISADAANEIGSLQATAGAGAVNVENAMGALTLGNVSASSGVTVTNAGEPLDIFGTVAGTTVGLWGSGFSGVGGTISAPSVSLSDSTAGDGWTVGPGSVTDGANGALAFTGTSALTISGADTFNVTASPSTTFTLTGGTPAAGTLNYNAQGRAVSGAPAAPSGEIDSATVAPVDFSGMTAVSVNDAAAAISTTTTTPAAATTTPPSTTPTTTAPKVTCTLRAPSAKVAVPKPVKARGKGKSKPAPATLKLAVSCTGAATATVSGKLTVTTPLAHPKKGAKTKTMSKSYTIRAVKSPVLTSVKRTVVIDVPAAVVTALSTRAATVSARFTLTDTYAGAKAGSGAKLALKRLT